MPTTSPRSHPQAAARDPVTGAPGVATDDENGVGPALYRMARELPRASSSGRGGRGGSRSIWTRPTTRPTGRQLTFFNGFYDTWCYLPLLAFVTFGREAEQYLCAAVLRPGNAVASEGAVALLSRLLPLLRRAFPRARFLVRLDAGFATPEVFDFLDTCPRLDYVVSMPKNAVLVRHAERHRGRGRACAAAGQHVYGETHYAPARGAAAACCDQGRGRPTRGPRARDNPRFVVTNLGRPPRSVYEKVARGDIENRIKELLDGLQIDRTSCCRFAANQFRVLLTAAAYVLMQELRLCAARTAWPALR